jgi:benzoyl-CoA 2,3-dioxygenase component B
MLTEEAHHMFVGQTGVGRVVAAHGRAHEGPPGRSPRDFGGIDLPTLQKYINFWASSSNDLYGAEVSSNSANFFGSSLKGRAWEMKKHDEHTALNQEKELELWEGGKLVTQSVPLRNAMNEVLREEFIEDNTKGIEYWNRILAEHGHRAAAACRTALQPQIGSYAEARFDLDGQPIDEATWQARQDEWLPQRVRPRLRASRSWCRSSSRGKIAGWIAPPPKGINGLPFEHEYVQL